MSDSTTSSTYAEAHRLSITDPDAFWLEAAGGIDWTTPPHHGCRRFAAPVLPVVPRR